MSEILEIGILFFLGVWSVVGIEISMYIGMKLSKEWKNDD